MYKGEPSYLQAWHGTGFSSPSPIPFPRQKCRPIPSHSHDKNCCPIPIPSHDKNCCPIPIQSHPTTKIVVTFPFPSHPTTKKTFKR